MIDHSSILQLISASNRGKFVAATESTTGLRSGELLKLTGPAIFLDRISGNRRKYNAESVHLQVEQILERIRAKALFGELDHPPTDDIDRLAYVMMKEVSHRIDDIWWDEKTKTYYINVTILDTENGRKLKTFHDAGSPLYVSLRSLLDPSRNRQMNGYIDAWMMALITIDFVSRPGFADAELTPLPVGNESLLAVCESLNLFQNANKSLTINSMKNKGKYAIESIVGKPTMPTNELKQAVAGVIKAVNHEFPTGFTFEQFNAEFEGTIGEAIVQLYSDTAELKVSIPDCDVDAAIHCLLDHEVFNVTEEVSYYLDALVEDEEAAVESLFMVIEDNEVSPGLENCSDAEFSANVESIINNSVVNYPNGFKADDFEDILAGITNQFEYTADITDGVLTIGTTEHSCTINLIGGEGDTFVFGDPNLVESVAGTESQRPYQMYEVATEANKLGKTHFVYSWKDMSGKGVKSTTNRNNEHVALLMEEGAGQKYNGKGGLQLEMLYMGGDAEEAAKVKADAKNRMQSKATRKPTSANEKMDLNYEKTLRKVYDRLKDIDGLDVEFNENGMGDNGTPEINIFISKDDVAEGKFPEGHEDEDLEFSIICEPTPQGTSMSLVFENNGNEKEYNDIRQLTSFLSEGATENLEIGVNTNLKDADNVQQYKVVDDEDEEEQQSNDVVADKFYTIIEDETPEIEGKPGDNKEPKKPTSSKGGSEEIAIIGDTELALEAMKVFGMPNSKYSGNFAIENMPTAYKHIWSGLSTHAKEFIAERGKLHFSKKAQNATESLKFWQTVDAIAIERHVLNNLGKLDVTAGLESKPFNPAFAALGIPQ